MGLTKNTQKIQVLPFATLLVLPAMYLFATNYYQNLQNINNRRNSLQIKKNVTLSSYFVKDYAIIFMQLLIHKLKELPTNLI